MRYVRMRFQVPQAVATVVLVICMICPLIEMFDSWDHTLQTGNDNEYALVILALTVGVTYPFAKAPLLASAASKQASISNFTISQCVSPLRLVLSGPGSFMPISPPCSELRI